MNRRYCRRVVLRWWANRSVPREWGQGTGAVSGAAAAQRLVVIRAAVVGAILAVAAVSSGAGSSDPDESGAMEEFLVERLEISGETGIDGRTLRAMFTAGPGDRTSREVLTQDVDRVIALYRDRGFIDAAVSIEFEPEAGGGTVVKVSIEEGPRYRVGQVSVAGLVSFDSAEARSSFDTREGQIFRPRILEADIDRLLSRYEESGHPFARVEPGPFEVPEEGLIDIELSVDEGPFVIVHAIRVEGNELTRASTVQKAFGIPPPRIYSQRHIERGRRRLKSVAVLPYYPVVEIEFEGEGKGVLAVRMAEGPTNSVTGMVGYAPGEGDDEDLVTGFADVDLGNLFGTGRKAGLRWRRVTSERSYTEISYHEPWAGGSRFDLGLGLRQLVDEEYVETEGSAALSTAVAGDVDLGAEVGVGRVVFGAGLGGSSRKYSAAVFTTWDTRDDVVNPRTGMDARGSIEYAVTRESSEGGAGRRSALELWRTASSIGRFFPVGVGSVLLVRGGVAAVWADAGGVPEYERFAVGGARWLRGYREEQFRSPAVVDATVEYRVLVGRRNRLSLFADGGVIAKAEGDARWAVEQRDRWMGKVGYGAGVRIGSPVGVVGFDYALSEDVRFPRGRVHIRVESSF
ncbi:hypothetical protein AMJ39_04815 [candidate division TA06 bacterium DG_24]|uniref:POTRA domain-containing protein n=1 Tax=candidate division TA06 bacterium DG_24 TaxID=1703770 RepID=A0A0S7WTM4_UNCT6|nr:MAG: hypothetical protein AMJ39_04815 [candidate division TA06 bacterium DG_24]